LFTLPDAITTIGKERTKMNPKRILVLAPHTDDAELGCGGTMAKYIEQGCDINVIAFSRAEDSLPEGAPSDTLEQEMRASLAKLGIGAGQIEVCGHPVRQLDRYRQDILERLVQLRKTFRPDWVLTPSSQDLHQDHAVIHVESMRAFNNCAVWGYELPWNMLHAHLNGFVALDERHIQSKQGALAEYKSQLALSRPYFMPDYAESLAKIRGLLARTPLAEAFEVLRATA
jgi:N-acetylglucosamine malate deacetylase 1